MVQRLAVEEELPTRRHLRRCQLIVLGRERGSESEEEKSVTHQ
jgi:hypothetical protein